MANKTGTQRHVHKYWKRNQTWACAMPNCTHFMPKNVAFNIEGKQSVCWKCNHESVIMNEKQLTMEKPWCNDCLIKYAVILDAEGNKVEATKLIEGIDKLTRDGLRTKYDEDTGLPIPKSIPKPVSAAEVIAKITSSAPQTISNKSNIEQEEHIEDSADTPFDPFGD